MTSANTRQQQPHFAFPKTGNHVPEDRDQRLVHTPYGKGLVIRTRERQAGVEMREVQLLDWTRKSDPTASTGPIRPPILYSSANFESITPSVGDDVLTLYGRGRVLEIRPDQTLVVLISSWRLAGRSRVTCYLHPSSVQVVRDKKIYEMTVYEKVEEAQKLKQQATQQFKAKDYQAALETFGKAVDAVRYVQHRSDSTNEVRADLLVIMITCSNNAGTCCTQLQRWDQAIEFAKNALVLIDALEKRKGKSIIQKVLNEEGFPDIKIFGEWRVKSNLITARALLEKQESSQAMEILKAAHDVIAKYTTDEFTRQPQLALSVKQLLNNDKEVIRLHNMAKEQRRVQLKKEKQRAQAMFGSSPKSTFEEEKKEAAVPSNSPIESSETSDKLAKNAVGLNEASEGTPTNNAPLEPNRVEQKERKAATDDNTVEWYQDPEVMTGLAIFTGTVVATVAGLTYLLSSRRR